MRYDQEHKARTRERLLQETSIAIRRDGLEGIGVASIMAAAGLTHGGFYAHFKSKDELVDHALDYMFEDRYAAFFSDLQNPDARAALVRFAEFYLSARHRDSRTHGCPIPHFIGQFPRLPDAAQARFLASIDRLKAGVAKLVERAGIDQPQRRASSAMSELVGAIMMSRLQAPDEADLTLGDALQSVKLKLGLVSDDASLSSERAGLSPTTAS